MTVASGFIIEMLIRKSRLSATGLPLTSRMTSPLWMPLFCGRAGRADVSHQNALHVLESHGLGNPRSYVLNHDSEIRAVDLAMIQDLIHHLTGEIDGNCKPDAFVAARSVRKDGRIDADEFAAIIHQRAAGIARIDRRVGLNEIFVVLDAQIAAIHGADDSHRDGLPDSKWISDGQGIIAYLDFGRITDGDGGEVASFDLQHGDIRFGIGADDFGLQLALIRKA